MADVQMSPPVGAGVGSTEQSIAAMQQAAADQANLMRVSTQVSSQIQAASSAAHTIEGANAAGGEVAKSAANDIRSSAKAQ